ncbi:MAG: EamA family transporter [Gaiella sp.]
MSAALLALAAALTLAVATGVTKQLVTDYAPGQLIGPLLLLNAALLAPFLPLGSWRWSGEIMWLHLASAGCIVAVSACVFFLFVHGSAAAVSFGTALSPIGAVLFSAVLLTGSLTWAQVVGAVVVTAAVAFAVGDAFGVARGRAAAAVLVNAVLGGLLTVLTKLLTDRGVGLPEIYVSRTLLAGAIWLVAVPPRDLPRRAVPALVGRSALQSAYFVLVIAAVARGTPTTVQTIAATTPLFLLLGIAARRRERPSPRLLAASVAVVAGVSLAVG